MTIYVLFAAAKGQKNIFTKDKALWFQQVMRQTSALEGFGKEVAKHTPREAQRRDGFLFGNYRRTQDLLLPNEWEGWPMRKRRQNDDL